MASSMELVVVVLAVPFVVVSYVFGTSVMVGCGATP